MILLPVVSAFLFLITAVLFFSECVCVCVFWAGYVPQSESEARGRRGGEERPTSMSVVYEILPECHGWGFVEWGIRDLGGGRWLI